MQVESSFFKNIRFLSIFLAALLALTMVDASFPRIADAQSTTWTPPAGTKGWCVYLGANVPNSCFADPVAGCEAQFQQFGGPGPFYGATDSSDPFIKNCAWKYTPGYSYAATATFTCSSGTRTMTGKGALCKAEDRKQFDCAPGRNSQWTNHPICIFNGAKKFYDNDFTSADGTLSFDRTYVSTPYGDMGTSVLSSSPSFANWAAFFDVQLQMTTDWDGGGIVSILNPAGASERFVKQSDGSMAPMTNDYYNNVPNTGWRVVFVGALPANLANVVAATSQWLVTDISNNVWTLQTYKDQSGQYRTAHPVSVQRPDGAVLTFTYDSSNVLTTITDQNGKSIGLTWTAGRTIASINLPGSYSVRYTYADSSGNTLTSASPAAFRLQKVEYLDATGTVQDSKSYVYGNTSYPSFITGILDSAGNTRWQATYDDQGRATYSAGPGGAFAETITYDANAYNFTRTQTDALGRKTIYNYQQANNSGGYGALLMSIQGVASTYALATTTSYTYTNDGNFFVASETDPEGRVTQYARNTVGDPTQITEAYGTASARTTGITWNSYFHLPTQIVRAGLTTNYGYDSQGRITSISQVDTTSQTVPYSTNGQTRTWTYTWGTSGSALGKLVTVDGPLAGTGDSQTFTYNTNGYLATVTNEVGKTTTVTAWDWRGAPTSVTDPNGVVTSFTYDIHGRPLTAIKNPGSSQSKYVFVYDIVGNLTQITLPTNGYLTYTYDLANRLTQIADDKGDTITLTPDGMGNPTQTTVKTSTGTITQQTSKVYDELGRLIQTLGAASTTPTKLAYDRVDNLTTITDGRSKVTNNTFDALNRVIKVTNPESQTVQYGYNVLNILTDHKDGRNLETTRVTDGFGDIIQEVSPDRGTRTYWYDAAARMTKLVDGDNEETDFTYDNAGRLLTKSFPGASQENMTFTYDSVASGNEGNGRLTSVTEQSGSSAFTYDALGRVTEDAKTIQGLNYSVSYAYDAGGHITQITLPSGRVVTYMRDADGLVTSVTTKPSASGTVANVATSVSYLPFGPLISLTYGNGLVLTRTYNANYWLTDTQVKYGSGSAVLDLGYQYYDDGRLGEIDDNAATGRTVYMSLSDSGRLTYANGPWGQESYSWDAAGNRIGDYLTVGSTTTSDNEITAGDSNHLVSTQDNNAVAKRTLLYRSGGDLYSDTAAGGSAFTYAYSARKRLVQVSAAGIAAATYGYDFKDQRVWRSVTGSTPIHYIFDQAGHLLAEHNGNTGAVIREYIWIDDMPIAVIDSSSGTATTYYIHTGHLDEPQVMTDASQAKVWDAYMTPFGNAKIFATASANIDLRLPGQWFQTEAAGSGLNQNGYRDYDPSLGRYIEADPLGLLGGQNPYAYVQGDVYDFVDPSGRGPVGATIGGAIGAVAGGAVGSAAAGSETVGSWGVGIVAAPAIVASGVGVGGYAGAKIGSLIEDLLSDKWDDVPRYFPPNSSGQCSSASGSGSPGRGPDEECEEQLNKDMINCQIVAAMKGNKGKGAQCRAVANTRYAECLRGGGVDAIKTPFYWGN